MLIWNSTCKRVSGRNTSESRWGEQKLKVSPDHDGSLAPVRGEMPGRIIGEEDPQTASQMWEILSQTEIATEQTLPFRWVLCWISPGNPPCSATGRVHPGKNMSSAFTTWKLWSRTPGGSPPTTLLRGISLGLIWGEYNLACQVLFQILGIKCTHYRA